MKQLILILLLVTPCSAATWFVRSDGSDTVCNGTVDAAAGVAPNCAYATPTKAITVSACSDVIKAKAGQTFDGVFSLTAKGCSVGTPITITSTDAGSLPVGRVAPNNATSMPRFRAPGAGGNYGAAFEAANNAAYWILDGLEITDNAGTLTNIPAMVNFGLGTTGAHDLTITRCYIHQKETGTNYDRSVRNGVSLESTSATMKWNYIGPFIGYPYGHVDFTPMQTQCVESTVIGTGLTFEDNYCSYWYSAFYFGGADTPPSHTATLSAGATTTSGTISDTTGLQAALTAGDFVMLRMELRLNATITTLPSDESGNPTIPGVLHRNSGQVMDSSDVSSPPNVYKGVIQFPDTPNSLANIIGIIDSDNYQFAWTNSVSHPPLNSTADLIMFKTVQLNSITGGNVLNYTPYGNSGLTHNPSTAAGGVAWCVGAEGRIANQIIRRNTFFIDPAFALNPPSHGSSSTPKGYLEIKNNYNSLYDGNYWLGFPSVVGWTGGSQYGRAPWITVSRITFTNNWIQPDETYAIPYMREGAAFLENQYTAGTPPQDWVFRNNVMIGVPLMIRSQDATNVSVTHNTVLNYGPTNASYSATIAIEGVWATYTFQNNIAAYQSFGMMCNQTPFTFAHCYPSANRVMLNNAIVDTRPDQSGGFTTSTWGTGSILAPTNLTSFTQVGFTDFSGHDYRLLASSPYYHQATDGTDPGVNWTELQAALGVSVANSVLKGNATMSGHFTLGLP